MSLPYSDPANPANPSPLFNDITAVRGDHMRANNNAIFADLTYLENEIAANWARTIFGDNAYGSTLVTDLNAITKSGFYTCYGAATGVPNADSSWFVMHQNSAVGTVSASQRAVAFSTEFVVYERTKISSTWGAWRQIGDVISDTGSGVVGHVAVINNVDGKHIADGGYPLFYTGKLEWFDDYINPSPSFPFLCLADADKVLSATNWPVLVPYLRNKPLRYMPGTTSVQTAFNITNYAITSNVATLTFGDLTAEKSILSGLVEDQLVHGSFTNWRTITLPLAIGTIAAGTYAITSLSASARTVSFSYTGTNISSTTVTAIAEFYPHRLESSIDTTGTQARHFQMVGRTLVSINDADGECIAGLRRRDRFQIHGHKYDYNTSTAGQGAGWGGGQSVGSNSSNVVVRDPVEIYSMGTPRTGKTTDPRSLIAVPYICGGQYVS